MEELVDVHTTRRTSWTDELAHPVDLDLHHESRLLLLVDLVGQFRQLFGEGSLHVRHLCLQLCKLKLQRRRQRLRLTARLWLWGARRTGQTAGPQQKRHTRQTAGPQRKRHTRQTAGPQQKRHTRQTAGPQQKRHTRQSAGPQQKRHTRQTAGPQRKRHTRQSAGPQRKRHTRQTAGPQRKRHAQKSSEQGGIATRICSSYSSSEWFNKSALKLDLKNVKL